MVYKHREEQECNDWCAPCCSECGQPCIPELIDSGIGPYEYWGQKGCDVQFSWLSDCCEAEIVEESSLDTALNLEEGTPNED